MKQQPLFDIAPEQPKTQTSPLYSAEFERFWNAVPRNHRVGKRDAWRAWLKATDKMPAEAAIEPEGFAYIQTDPINRPQHRENVPLSQLGSVRSRVAREIFNHLRVCNRPFCEACNSRNVRVYRALFLERHGPSRCQFGPPPGQRGEQSIEQKRAEERLLEEFRRRNPGINPPSQYYDQEGRYAGCQHADCV